MSRGAFTALSGGPTRAQSGEARLTRAARPTRGLGVFSGENALSVSLGFCELT